MADTATAIEQHYSHPGLTDRILTALRAAGLDLNALSYADLSPLDQFHTRGRDATTELAQLAGLGSGMRVLDVGSGIGGPARQLAAEFGCLVSGVDLTEEFCVTATRLSELVGLNHCVEFRHANALDLPYEASTFDAVCTEHVSMNVADKDQMYREVARILKPGGKVAIYDVAAGAEAPIHLPVPWAREAKASFLSTPGKMREAMEEAGLEIVEWHDGTAEAMEWFKRVAERYAAGDPAPRLGLQLLMGPEWPAMIANQARNLAENRVSMIKVVLRKVG